MRTRIVTGLTVACCFLMLSGCPSEGENDETPTDASDGSVVSDTAPEIDSSDVPKATDATDASDVSDTSDSCVQACDAVAIPCCDENGNFVQIMECTCDGLQCPNGLTHDDECGFGDAN